MSLSEAKKGAKRVHKSQKLSKKWLKVAIKVKVG